MGYKLYDNVIIYSKANCKDTEIPGAYIADASDKKMCENAANWASIHQGHYENGKYISDKPIEGNKDIYTNANFRLSFLSYAGNSTQGGKLSFWNCIITAPDNKQFMVGINSEMLLDVIKSSTIIGGNVQEEVVFARENGNLGVLVKDSPAYQDAIDYEQKRADINKKKTSKWKPGYSYNTLTESDVCVGSIKKYYDIKVFRNTLKFTKLDKPKNICIYGGIYKDNIKTTKDLLEYLIEVKPNSKDDYAYQYSCARIYDIHPSFPARQEGKAVLENNLTEDDIYKYIEECQLTLLDNFVNMYNYRKEHNIRLYSYSSYFTYVDTEQLYVANEIISRAEFFSICKDGKYSDKIKSIFDKYHIEFS